MLSALFAAAIVGDAARIRSHNLWHPPWNTQERFLRLSRDKCSIVTFLPYDLARLPASRAFLTAAAARRSVACPIFHHLDCYIRAYRAFKSAFIVARLVRLDAGEPQLCLAEFAKRPTDHSLLRKILILSHTSLFFWLRSFDRGFAAHGVNQALATFTREGDHSSTMDGPLPDVFACAGFNLPAKLRCPTPRRSARACRSGFPLHLGAAFHPYRPCFECPVPRISDLPALGRDRHFR